jgi:hypothetical protein
MQHSNTASVSIMLDITTVQAVDARSTLQKLAVRSMQLTDDTCVSVRTVVLANASMPV